MHERSAKKQESAFEIAGSKTSRSFTEVKE